MAHRLRDAYRALARLLRAGVVLTEALEHLRRDGTLADPPAGDLQQAVGGGAPFSEALARHPELFPDEDVALVEAGEATGRLDVNLDRLALLREEREEARRRLLTESVYPILLFHAAALLIPLASLAVARRFTVAGWLGRVALILGTAWGLVLLLRRLARSAVWRERLRRAIDLLPGFGAAARHRRRVTFCTVLEAAYQAGVPIERAVRLAARAARLPDAEEAARAVQVGEPLTAGLSRTGIFPIGVLTRLATGERAGEISQVLLAVADEEAAQAREIFKRSMVVLGQVVFLLVAAWIVWFVVSFYLGIYGKYL